MSIPSFTFGETFTVCFWYNKSNIESPTRLLDFAGTNTINVNSFILFFDTNGLLNLYSNDDYYTNFNNGIRLTGTACDGNWRHIAFVCTYGTVTSSKYDYYVNGMYNTFNGFRVRNISRTSNFIGKSNYTDGTTTMMLDDFRLYNSALSQSDILSIYRSGFYIPDYTLVLWYTFNDWTAGSSIINNGALGTSNNGTLYGGTIPAISRNGVTTLCLSLSRSSTQYMFIPSFTFGGGSFTVCFWYKKSVQNEQYTRVFDFAGINTFGLQNFLIHFNSDTLSFFSSDTPTTNINNSINLMPASTSCDGQWRHIALVCTFHTPTVSKYTCYVNGVVGVTFTGPVVMNATRTSNFIGQSNGTDGTTTLLLDDFRLYSRALSTSDIITVYNSAVFV